MGWKLCIRHGVNHKQWQHWCPHSTSRIPIRLCRPSQSPSTYMCVESRQGCRPQRTRTETTECRRSGKCIPQRSLGAETTFRIRRIPRPRRLCPIHLLIVLFTPMFFRRIVSSNVWVSCHAGPHSLNGVFSVPEKIPFLVKIWPFFLKLGLGHTGEFHVAINLWNFRSMINNRTNLVSNPPFLRWRATIVLHGLGENEWHEFVGN